MIRWIGGAILMLIAAAIALTVAFVMLAFFGAIVLGALSAL